MDIKKNLNDMTGAAAEVRDGMKGVWLAREIKKELDGGAALEDIVLRYVPILDAAAVRSDMEQLQMGIQSMQDAARQTVTSEWVRQQLADALAELDTQRRAAYLQNLIKGAAAAYPDSLQDAARELLERLETVQEYTQEDVGALLDMAGTLLPQIGELLQRSCVRAMLGRMDRLDHDRVAARIDSGKAAVTAYAASCYIMQKRGRSVKAKGQIDSNTPAFAVGAAAAAAVEGSRLAELYNAGGLTVQELADGLKNLFTAAVTFTGKSLVCALALGAYAFAVVALAEVFFHVFISLGAFAYFSLFWLVIGSALLAAGIVGTAVTVEDCEQLIQRAWELLKSLWGKIVAVWQGDGAAGDAAECASEDAAECEEEEESEEDDEDEGDFQGAFA